MSKIENNIVNSIKLLSLDMIKNWASDNVGLALSSVTILYTLYMKHLRFDSENPKWINRDRVIVSNHFLPVLNSTIHMFDDGVSESDNQVTQEIGSRKSCDVVASSVGIALAERYLESLVKSENSKSKLINFKTYCVCTYTDLMSGVSSESLAFAGKEKLKNLIFLVIKDSNEEFYYEDVFEHYESLGFNVIEVKESDIGAINEELDDAKDSKEPSIIIIKSENNKDDFIEKYQMNENSFSIIPEYYENIKKHVSRRLGKILTKWQELKNESLENTKLKEIIEFLETQNLKINFNPDNIKINDNYEEELFLGNNKIFNILASKSPFILSCNSDNFKCNITNSELMSKKNPVGRNISFGNRILAMGGIANGLASLGFKVFVSSHLTDSNYLRESIKFSTEYNLPVNYIFATNENMKTTDEINSLRLISNLINFCPADINEIIGMYSILANYQKCSAIIVGDEKIKKLTGTNPKYVVAGAYRVKREKGEASGIIIATGSEVSLALKVAEELLPRGIDLRVVTMPSQELFQLQNERYKYSLLPKELKTFVIEFGSNDLWHKYVTDEDYIFGMNKYSISKTKEELLKYSNLEVDSIKDKILEIMKNN